MTKSVIITAGGTGQRIGGDLPKQFIKIIDQPILALSIHKFASYDTQIQIIVTLPEHEIERWNQICKEIHFEIEHMVVPGGENRFESVKNALAHVEGDICAIHDGVRPFVGAEVIESAFYTAEKEGSAVPVMPLTESIRIIGKGSSRSMDRSDFRSVQTPQVFQTADIKAAYEQAYSENFTDDASVYEASGRQIHLVDGNPENIKITTPLDLKIANLLSTKDN